PGKLNSSI
ncbi:hypothetical protein D046_8334B, partial [Vibrio parahaemolyticus V-223/04]